ncbi:PAAR-like domain-containing protein [Paracoccus caeni]
MIVCLAPDVCLTPIGSAMVPVPYMIVSRLDWSQRTAPHTTFGGQEAFTMASRTDKVVGNEPGTVSVASGPRQTI